MLYNENKCPFSFTAFELFVAVFINYYYDALRFVYSPRRKATNVLEDKNIN